MGKNGIDSQVSADVIVIPDNLPEVHWINKLEKKKAGMESGRIVF